MAATLIHPTALVAPGARLGEGVEIGAYSLVEEHVQLGDGCRLASHVIVRGRTIVGAGTIIDSFANLGGPAQDLKCRTDDTYLEIGERNTIREGVTIHRSNHEGGVTRIGNDNYLMAYVHCGHDVVLGDGNMLANMVNLAGHVQVDDKVVLGGLAAVHQRVRIGSYAMVGGLSGVNQDVPPYSLVEGNPARVKGLNTIGLRRNGVASEVRGGLRAILRRYYLSGRNRGEVLEELLGEEFASAEERTLVEFLTALRGAPNGRQLER